MLEKVGGIFKSGFGSWCTFSMENCFPYDIIIFPLGKKKFHHLHLFAARILLLRFMGNAGFP